MNIIKKTVTHLTLTQILLIVVSSGVTLAASGTSFDNNHLELISELEKGTRVLEYKLQYQSYESNKTLPFDIDYSKPIWHFADDVSPTGVEKKTMLLIEPGTSKVKFSREGYSQAIYSWSKDVELVKSCKKLGYDGETRTELHGYSGEEPLFGYVSEQSLLVNQELSSFEMGMDIFLSTYRGVGLSEYLQSDEVEQYTIEDINQENIMAVNYVNKKKRSKRLLLDVSKGGVIVSEEYHARSGAVAFKMSYEWMQNETGDWIPSRAIGVSGARNPIVYAWTFEDVKKNHMTPSSEMYRVDFPVGTEVDDRIIDVHYVVGGELEKDYATQISESVKQTIEKNPELSTLSPLRTSANTSKTSVLEKSNLSKEVKNTQAVDSKNTSYFILGGLITFVILLVILTFKKISQKLSIFLVMVLMLCINAEGIVSSSTTLQEGFDGWTAPVAGKRIPVYQCGLNASAFVLSFFDKDYKVEHLMKRMNPSLDGIALLEIVEVLNLYGINIEMRNEVDVDVLSEYLQQNKSIAILPTRINGEKGHYYIIAPGKKSDFILIDAGVSVKNVKKEKVNKYLKRNNGTVGFIVLNENSNNADMIEFNTDVYDLGKFRLSSKEVNAVFRLANVSQSNILITNVITSCSCIAPDCIGRTINSKEQIETKVSIVPSAWGIGKNRKKEVIFCFGDGSKKTVTISGICEDGKGLHGIGYSPKSINVTIGGNEINIQRQIKIDSLEKKIHVETSNNEWLEIDLVNQVNNSFLNVDVIVDKVSHISDVGYIYLWTKDNVPKLSIPVKVNIEKKFQISPKIATLNIENSNQKIAKFELLSLSNNCDKIKVVDLDSKNSDLVLEEIADCENNKTIIKGYLKSSKLERGLYPISVRVSQGGNVDFSEKVYILLK